MRFENFSDKCALLYENILNGNSDVDVEYIEHHFDNEAGAQYGLHATYGGTISGEPFKVYMTMDPSDPNEGIDIGLVTGEGDQPLSDPRLAERAAQAAEHALRFDISNGLIDFDEM